ncbi:MAG: 5-amino-6-(D-ribitylamino)uracil--L-tyrosine 4-hydroxyphenyl transferase CofH [Acidobacteria bacterium]|nr:5-amino-6-(D-ribitylamino)uracil--L-tyrosine 4-hydroxyphenyl transferase CofH [Acidobacteriota bacterium]
MNRFVTAVHLRPAEQVHVLWATTRRREGTTVVEVSALDAASWTATVEAKLGAVATSVDGVEPLAWVVEPQQALSLAQQGVPGWRITVIDTGIRADVVEAVARTQAAFLRGGRSHATELAQITALPGTVARVSVFVDDVHEALGAVGSGAEDLVLRGWTSAMVGELRDSLGGRLVERAVYPPGVSVEDLRSHLDADRFAAALELVDASGAARPKDEWAPGKNMAAPVPERRFSAQWGDEAWRSVSGESASRDLAVDLGGILDRAIEGTAPTQTEVVRLFSARGDEVDAIAGVADVLRKRVNGDVVTYVVNRNINYTNQCYFKCGFCAFSKGPRSLELRGDPYLMTIPQVVERAVEAHRRGATEVCLQGGIHPDFTGDFYIALLESIKEHIPEMHCHGFTPLEVWQGADTLGVSVKEFLQRLRNAGLGSLPGTAAEILDDRIREYLCPDKIRTGQWAEVMVTAHGLGLRSTATMMFGHIDDAASWAEHFEVLRTIQRSTGGFTEFVPLPFVHMGAPIYLRGRSRPGPTWDETVLVHSVARIAFHGLIDNIQASWVKLGLDAGVRLLSAGCNDLGGTLMGETISHAAGAAHGTEMAPEDFVSAIEAAGRTPRQRTTLYEEFVSRVGWSSGSAGGRRSTSGSMSDSP